MKNTLYFVLFYAAIFTVSSCKNEVEKATEPVFDLAEAKAAVEARVDLFEEAMNSKDSVGLSNCYTKDAKLMQPNGETVEGRENIKKLFGMWMKGPMMQIKINTVEVWGTENMLVAENKWTFINQSGKTVDTGKSLEIYNQEDGVWKLYRDCFNSDMPAHQ
jgi:uncharacterized protein (TIGR02246 family)